MRVTKVEHKDGIYFVTKTPNLIERLFGVKEEIERYRTDGEAFHYFNHLKAFYKSTGEMLSPTDKMTDILNNYLRSF
jgi:hypothetical protein